MPILLRDVRFNCSTWTTSILRRILTHLWSHAVVHNDIDLTERRSLNNTGKQSYWALSDSYINRRTTSLVGYRSSQAGIHDDILQIYVDRVNLFCRNSALLNFRDRLLINKYYTAILFIRYISNANIGDDFVSYHAGSLCSCHSGKT